MDTFIFAFSCIAPLILLVALGYLLKKVKILTDGFTAVANNLTYTILLPAMMFVNLYDIESLDSMDWKAVIFCVTATLVIFFLALAAVNIFVKDKEKRGVVWVSVFRGNTTVIGMPLALSLSGMLGATTLASCLAFVIPLLTVLSVISLSFFRGGGAKITFWGIVKKVATHPFVIGSLLGILALAFRQLFVVQGIIWRLSDAKIAFGFVNTLADIASPIALIALGASFKFASVKKMIAPLSLGVLLRLVFFPLLAVGGALIFNFSAPQLAAVIGIFASSSGVSNVPMAQQMGQDTELAGQIVVWTTLLSSFTIFLIVLILRALGRL